MSNNLYDIKMKYACQSLEDALEFDDLEKFLAGSPIYNINTTNSSGELVSSTMYRMEAIYEKYRNDVNSHFDNDVYNELIDLGKNTRATFGLINGLLDIEYQMLAEKEERAPFHLDCETLLNTFRKNIVDNRELYKADYYQADGLQEMLDEHNEILKNSFNTKLY